MATTPRKTRTTAAATPSTDTPTRRKAQSASTADRAPAPRRAAASTPGAPTRPRRTAAAASAATEAPTRKRSTKAAPTGAAASVDAAPAPAPAPIRKLRARGPTAVTGESDAAPRRRVRTLTTPADTASPAARKLRAKPGAEVTVPETPKRHRAKVGEAILDEETGKKTGRVRKTAQRATPTPFEQVEQLKQTVLAALDDMKARELLVLDVRPLTSMFDWRIIVTGTSSRHLSSMAEEVSKRAKAIGMPPMYISGDRESDWVLVDLGDIVVDLMSDQARTRYALEKLWQVPAAPTAA